MNPRNDIPPVGGLGKKVEPKVIVPEWRPYKPGIEINAKGELRTVIPENEEAHLHIMKGNP